MRGVIILARQFATIINGDDVEQLDPWLVAAEATELSALAKGIRRDIDAVRAAIVEPWTTSPVEGQINRVKAIKRQMYGRAKYALLKQRVDRRMKGRWLERAPAVAPKVRKSPWLTARSHPDRRAAIDGCRA